VVFLVIAGPPPSLPWLCLSIEVILFCPVLSPIVANQPFFFLLAFKHHPFSCFPPPFLRLMWFSSNVGQPVVLPVTVSSHLVCGFLALLKTSPSRGLFFYTPRSEVAFPEREMFS